MSKQTKKHAAKKRELAGNAIYSVVKIVVIILAGMVIYRAGASAFRYGERLFGEPPVAEAPGEDISVTITEQESDRDIALKLEEAGLVRDAALFELQEKLLGDKDGIQPGTYTLNTSQRPEEMIGIMSTPAAAEGEE